MTNKKGFSRCGELYIDRLREEGRYSTAHVYKNALFSFSVFCGTCNVSFRQITRESLRLYGQYLYENGLKLNTISTYMRMLRSIYNRGVDTHQAPYVHGLFRDVFTGVDTRQKKAIPIGELHMLLNKPSVLTAVYRRSHAASSSASIFVCTAFTVSSYASL